MTLFNSVLSPNCLLVSLNAEVLGVVVVVGCVQGSRSQVSTFSCYSHCLPLTQNASKGYENNFHEPLPLYRLSMFCHNCVTCPSICKDPTTWVLGCASYPGICTHTGAGDTVWQCILYLYNTLNASDAYIHQYIGLTLVQVMTCHLCSTKPSPEPILTY